MQHMTPHTWIAGAANAHNYLITQPYVALLYLKTFFWPSRTLRRLRPHSFCNN